MTAAASPNPALERWLEAIASKPVPVLAGSIGALARLKRQGDEAKPRDIAAAVQRDPMLTLIVLRYLQSNHSRRMLEDITTPEHAVMMLGTQRFFAAFQVLPAVEDILRGRPAALAGLMQVVGRARTAAAYAGAFAAARADLVLAQVVAAALLHDLAELLLWCFAPDQAEDIDRRLRATPGLRSADAQRDVLGVTLLELQLALARRWQLPDLIQSLMDDSQADKPRVQTVALAVAITRHSWRGWDNPALPYDFECINRQLGIAPATARRRIFEAALHSMAEREDTGESLSQSHLPPLPAEAKAGDKPGGGERGAANALDWLRRIARGQVLEGRPRGGLVQDARHDQMVAVAALMDGMCAGLGFRSGAFMVPAGPDRRMAAKFLAAGGQGIEWLQAEPRAAKALQDAALTKAAAFHSDRGSAPPKGLFVWPVTSRGAVCALAVALEPQGPEALALESFQRFKELGRSFNEALEQLGGNPFWLQRPG
jgi:HD-like signal output (HDOD) protein